MKLKRFFRNSSLIATLVLGAMIVAAIVAQGATVNSSAAQSTVTRQPRPHPESHLKLAGAATSIESGNITLYPRPHPKSHLKLSAPDSVTRIPRPHPQSHIRLTATATAVNQP